MSPAFIKGIKEYLPEASITFDKFHILKVINKAIDQVRREIVQSAKAKVRGFRTFRNFRIVVFLLTGDLNFKAINQNTTIK